MFREIDNFYLQQPEPTQSCLLALRDYLLRYNPGISEGLSYGMPFFYFRGKRFCYLWTDKKTGQPYIGWVDGKLLDHPLLEAGNRSRMKILPVDADADLPVKTINVLLQQAIGLYR